MVHTMVVEMSIDPTRVAEVEAHLRDDIVAWARRQPGFVSGQWLRAEDGSSGMGVVVFASGEAAANAAEGPRNFGRDDARAWNVERVTILEQIASA